MTESQDVTTQISTFWNVGSFSTNRTITQTVAGREQVLPEWFNIFYFCLRLIQGFISFSANFLTIVAIVKFPELRNSCTNYFVASLAAADALSGLLTFIQINTIYVLNKKTQKWINACYFELFMNIVSVFGNLYGMLVITIDRYIYIQWPLKYYAIVTPKRSVLAIVIVWTFVGSMVFLALLFGSQLTIGVPCRWSIVLVYDVYNYLINLQFYTITSTLFLIYTLIGLLVMKLNRQVRKLAPNDIAAAQSVGGNRVKKERKTIKVMAMVLGVYMVCYLPTAVYHVIMAEKPQTLTVVVISRWMNFLMWMNNLANPFIYAWKIPEFRRAFSKLLHLNTLEGNSTGDPSYLSSSMN